MSLLQLNASTLIVTKKELEAFLKSFIIDKDYINHQFDIDNNLFDYNGLSLESVTQIDDEKANTDVVARGTQDMSSFLSSLYNESSRLCKLTKASSRSEKTSQDKKGKLLKGLKHTNRDCIVDSTGGGGRRFSRLYSRLKNKIPLIFRKHKDEHDRLSTRIADDPKNEPRSSNSGVTSSLWRYPSSVMDIYLGSNQNGSINRNNTTISIRYSIARHISTRTSDNEGGRSFASLVNPDLGIIPIRKDYPQEEDYYMLRLSRESGLNMTNEDTLQDSENFSVPLFTNPRGNASLEQGENTEDEEQVTTSMEMASIDTDLYISQISDEMTPLRRQTDVGSSTIPPSLIDSGAAAVSSHLSGTGNTAQQRHTELKAESVQENNSVEEAEQILGSPYMGHTLEGQVVEAEEDEKYHQNLVDEGVIAELESAPPTKSPECNDSTLAVACSEAEQSQSDNEDVEGTDLSGSYCSIMISPPHFHKLL